MTSFSDLGVDSSRTSYDTALCLIPPRELWDSIDSIRSLHDNAWPRWPPHINLVYPFLEEDLLPTASEILSRADLTPLNTLHLDLQEIDTFVHKKRNTIYMRPIHGQDTEIVSELVISIRRTLGLPLSEPFRPHMTVAQSQNIHPTTHHELLEMAQSVVPLNWSTSQLSILVRQPDGVMKLWGSLDLSTHRTKLLAMPRDFYTKSTLSKCPRNTTTALALQPGYHFSQDTQHWLPVPDPASPAADIFYSNRVIVASLNVSDYADLPLEAMIKAPLVADLLVDRSAADILVLQGVTSCILSVLLRSRDILDRYPYCTHAPPRQAKTGPIVSLFNNVVLSKWPLQWQVLDLDPPTERSGCLVAVFPTIQLGASIDGNKLLPLAVVACQLPCGTTDGTTTAMVKAIQTIVANLKSDYSEHTWVVAGDFGVTTSSFTIRQALEKGSLSSGGRHALLEFNITLDRLGFRDAWTTTRLGTGESSDLKVNMETDYTVNEGEQAATSMFSANMSNLGSVHGNGAEEIRPQRNARILTGKQSQLQARGFNLFGHVTSSNDNSLAPIRMHRGIRSLFLLENAQNSIQLSDKPSTVEFLQAPSTLDNIEALHKYLALQELVPGPTDRTIRAESLKVLERVLLDEPLELSEIGKPKTVALVLTTVGPFGLGVWSETSTVNCLCIGNLSSKTFFTLASQRLKKGLGNELSSLRRGKGSAGIKFELSIRGIKFDIYYCAATSIAETWPEVMKRPSSDPVFSLPFDTLAQLKPVRDLYYLHKSVPDMAQYRVAHVAIRTWAQSRGLFDSTVGLLGDAHITALLVPVCKLLAFEGRDGSTPDVITTFFHHYADFDWKTQVVYDPFFHGRLEYRRGFREAMCLLGWHPPAINTATSLTTSSATTITAEFKRARTLLSRDGVTWPQFFGHLVDSPRSPATSASVEFLESYRVYVRVEARHWGPSAAKLGRFTHRLRDQCAKILLEIDKKLPALRARIWPTCFAEKSDNEDWPSQRKEYHASHLLGLEWSDSCSISNDERTLLAILRELDQRMSKYYESRVCWMKSSLVQANELRSLRLRQTQIRVVDDADEMHSEDYDSMTDDEDEEWEDGEKYQGQGPALHGDVLKPANSLSSTTQGVAKMDHKLRSAADVINRLRWDPSMDVGDYAVGYVDRFRGTQEKLLEQWKSEQTDEDFIPQHRILYFRRVGDGAVVWDRKLRIDEIFGSCGADHGDAGGDYGHHADENTTI